LDSEILTSQYSALGVNLTNAIALTLGVSLNKFEFPPHSGLNVISDNGGPITNWPRGRIADKGQSLAAQVRHPCHSASTEGAKRERQNRSLGHNESIDG
jgi:hypothetical protein